MPVMFDREFEQKENSQKFTKTGPSEVEGLGWLLPPNSLLKFVDFVKRSKGGGHEKFSGGKPRTPIFAHFSPPNMNFVLTGLQKERSSPSVSIPLKKFNPAKSSFILIHHKAELTAYFILPPEGVTEP